MTRHRFGIGFVLVLALGLSTTALAAKKPKAPKTPSAPVVPIRVDLPTGYYLDNAQVAEDRPVWRDAPDGDFTYSVKREFPDSNAARLLAIAESCYPSREALIEIAATHYFEMGSDTAQGPLWWCDGPGVRRVPYAVTAGALRHYLDLSERFRNHDYTVPGGRGLYGTELVYHAKIEARQDFVAAGKAYQQVYVAYLSLQWAYDDGTFSPSFQAHRVVVLDSAGNVRQIVGDGSAVENVTFSMHRAVGKVDRIFR